MAAIKIIIYLTRMPRLVGGEHHAYNPMNITQSGWFSLLILLYVVPSVFAGEAEDLKTIRMIKSEGDRQMVLQMGELFLKKYPASESRPDVLFMLADADDDFQRKRDYLRRITEEHDNSHWAAKAHLEMGKIYLLNGDNSSAAREFYSIIKRHEDDPLLGEAFFLMGISTLAGGDYREARVNFEEAIKSSEQDDIKRRAEIGIADSYYLSGEYMTSSILYKRLLGRKLKNEHMAKVLLNLALSHSASGDADSANELFKRIVMDHPSSLESFSASKRLHEIEDAVKGGKSGVGPYLQIGVYSSLKAATEFKSALAEMGLIPTIVEGEVYKVLLGPFGDDIEAQIVSERLKNEKGIDSFVVER